jgi:hypothetical protein
MGRRPGYRTGPLSSNRHGVCGTDATRDFQAVTLIGGQATPGRTQAHARVIATGSKGGKLDKNDMRCSAGVMGGGASRPLF